MKINQYCCHDGSWQPGLTAATRDEALDKMLGTLCSEHFYAVNDELSHEGILQALIERESLRSTAMGEGIAFPHARLENLTQALIAVATFAEPVMFGEEPIRIVCMILVPASDPGVSLKIMAHIARILGEEGARERVLSAQSARDLSSLFVRKDETIEETICAHDIMRMPRWSVTEETPVSECAKLMSNYQLLAIPVINREQQVVGEITAELLFRYGLPDFFARLKSVSFVAEFDPFEKYFEDERHTLVGEIMSKEACVVPKEHTMMEIVFDLAIRQYPKLYVVDEQQRWVGTVTKGTILDNVINI